MHVFPVALDWDMAKCCVFFANPDRNIRQTCAQVCISHTDATANTQPSRMVLVKGQMTTFSTSSTPAVMC